MPEVLEFLSDKKHAIQCIPKRALECEDDHWATTTYSDFATHTFQTKYGHGYTHFTKYIPLFCAIFVVTPTPRGAREERTLVTFGWEILLWSTSIYPKS